MKMNNAKNNERTANVTFDACFDACRDFFKTTNPRKLLSYKGLSAAADCERGWSRTTDPSDLSVGMLYLFAMP